MVEGISASKSLSLEAATMDAECKPETESDGVDAAGRDQRSELVSSNSEAGGALGPGLPEAFRSAAISKLAGLVAESASMQGRRPNQEDRHVKVPDLTKAARALKLPIDHLDQPCAFFAVYDGHQGHLCSEFIAKSLHMRLLKRLSAEQKRTAWSDDRVISALREVFDELDAEFLAKYRTSPDGCTAVVAFLTGERLFVAWVGDSRAVLCRTTSRGSIATVPLTEDHRPSVESEAQRVRKAGGSIVRFDRAPRVAQPDYDERVREIRRAKAQGLGTIGKEPVALAVSRSFGDRDFKLVTGRALLVATPSVRCVHLNSSCKFLALMCDGISDVMRNEEVVFELDFLREPTDPLANSRAVCGALVQEAYKRGSDDNLTVVYVQFSWSADDATDQQKAMKKPRTA